MEKKLTKKDKFGMLKEYMVELGRTDLVEFIDNELSLLEKKASSGKMTNTQKENEEIKKVILGVLTEIGEYATITDIQAKNDTLGVLSNQKISALLKQLVDTNQVLKKTEKKKAYFKIAE